MKKKHNYQSEIKIPSTVKIEKRDTSILFEGPLGSNKLELKKVDHNGSIGIEIDQEKKTITVIGFSKSVYCSLLKTIKNRINGVSQGYILYLRIVGIGYKCSLKDNILTFKLGFSHDVKYRIPDSIRIFLVQPTLISIFGVDKNQVSQIAAQIRSIRPPSAYKGKGIRLLKEIVRIKQGKQK